MVYRPHLPPPLPEAPSRPAVDAGSQSFPEPRTGQGLVDEMVRPTLGPPMPEQPVTLVTAVTRLHQMTFEDLARADFSVEIEVPWLKRHLWLVPTSGSVETLVQRGVERGYVWTAAELADLYAIELLGAEDRRAIVLLKAHFGIEIVSVIPDIEKPDG